MSATKIAVDDFLATGRGRADLEALVVPLAAWVAGQRPQESTVDLLDTAPATLTRPLALIDGIPYAATWVWVQRTIGESVIDGRLVRHAPPLVETTRELLVVRGDGVLFGPGGVRPLGEVGLTVKLAEPVRAGKEWRAPALKAYAAGRRRAPGAMLPAGHPARRRDER